MQRGGGGTAMRDPAALVCDMTLALAKDTQGADLTHRPPENTYLE